MIVEIHGIECEKMDKIEQTLRAFGLKDADKFKEKIVASADSGRARRVETHRLVLEADEVLVFLREPGELCLTIDGSPQWIFYILGWLSARHNISADIGVEKIYRETVETPAERASREVCDNDDRPRRWGIMYRSKQ
jgi:hypothetical protein